MTIPTAHGTWTNSARSAENDPGGAMESPITWYDILGVLPGAETERIRSEYDAKTAVLRPDLTSGAPSSVLQAASAAQDLLDTAWQVLGDPASRGRYDESVGLPRSGGGLQP